MTAKEPAVTVQEVSKQEWAMLAFHAARAPQRVQVTVKTAAAEVTDDGAVGSARTGFWFFLAVATAGLAWYLI